MLLMGILTLLVFNAVNFRRDLSIYYNRISIIILIYCILNNTISLFIIEKGISLHGGLLQITTLSQIFNIFLFFLIIIILQLTSFYPRKLWTSKKIKILNIYYNSKIFNKMGEQFKITEYPLILLFITTGAIFLMSTNDLISIFLSIELQSYGLYLLSTIYRNSEFSTIGGLIYFLLGGLSSCFLLLGTSLIYTNSGTTNLDSLYVIISLSNTENNLYTWYQPNYINLALLIFSVGFLFKISAAPFHFWSPDVYDAIPTIVTTFVVIIAKISILIFFLELIYYTNNIFTNFNWTVTLLISSLFSLIIGTVVGLTQFRIKRLLAYSTISHLGFLLLALSISNIESIQAFIFYLVQYSISNLNVFFILIAIGYSLYYYITNNKEYLELLDSNNSPIQLISQLRGFFFINPVLSLSLAITIFSFIGIPPLVGFFAKQMVLTAALNKGFFFLSLIGILTSVIGAVYYLNLIKEVFFYYPEYKLNPFIQDIELKINSTLSKKKQYFRFEYSNIVLSNTISITISIITLVILLFIFINKEWLSMGTILVQILFIN